MPDAVKDVLIRVTTEQKQARLDPPDTEPAKRAFEEFGEKAKESIEALREEFKSTREQASELRTEAEKLKDANRTFEDMRSQSRLVGEGLNQAARGMFELARGAALLGVSSDTDLRKFAQRLAQIQGTFDAIAGTILTVSGLQRSLAGLNLSGLGILGPIGLAGGAALAGVGSQIAIENARRENARRAREQAVQDALTNVEAARTRRSIEQNSRIRQIDFLGDDHRANALSEELDRLRSLGIRSLEQEAIQRLDAPSSGLFFDPRIGPGGREAAINRITGGSLAGQPLQQQQTLLDRQQALSAEIELQQRLVREKEREIQLTESALQRDIQQLRVAERHVNAVERRLQLEESRVAGIEAELGDLSPAQRQRVAAIREQFEASNRLTDDQLRFLGRVLPFATAGIRQGERRQRGIEAGGIEFLGGLVGEDRRDELQQQIANLRRQSDLQDGLQRAIEEATSVANRKIEEDTARLAELTQQLQSALTRLAEVDVEIAENRRLVEALE